MLVGQALGLDVPGPVQVALDEAFAASERSDRLARRRLEQLADLLHPAGHLESAAATAEGGLDGDRQAVFFGERHDFVGVGDRVGRAGHQRCPDLLGDVPGLDLVAEGLDGRRWRADPGQSGVQHGLGEPGVLGQETVAGVDGVGAAALGYLDQFRLVEVGLRRGGPVECEGLIGQLDEHRSGVGICVGHHGRNTRVPGCPNDPHRDLATVGHQLGDRHDPESRFSPGCWCSVRAVFVSPSAATSGPRDSTVASSWCCPSATAY